MDLFVAALIALGMGLMIPIGNYLIDAYFTRKETFVDSLQEKMKGSVDAPVK